MATRRRGGARRCTDGLNRKNLPKTRFKKFVKVTGYSYIIHICLQQFRQILKRIPWPETEFIWIYWILLRSIRGYHIKLTSFQRVSAIWSHCEQLAWNACSSAEKGCCGGAAMWCPGHFRLGAAAAVLCRAAAAVCAAAPETREPYFHGQGFEGEAWTPPALHSGKEIKQLRKCGSFFLVCLFNKLKLRMFTKFDEVAKMKF